MTVRTAIRHTATLAGGLAAAAAILTGAQPANAAEPRQDRTETAPAAVRKVVPPGGCSPYYKRKTSGASAQVRECRSRSGKSIRVDGWVTDKANDGQCAQVYANYNVYPGRDYSPRACPKGDTDRFVFPWRKGTDAYVYLREV